MRYVHPVCVCKSLRSLPCERLHLRVERAIADSKFPCHLADICLLIVKIGIKVSMDLLHKGLFGRIQFSFFDFLRLFQRGRRKIENFILQDFPVSDEAFYGRSQ